MQCLALPKLGAACSVVVPAWRASRSRNWLNPSPHAPSPPTCSRSRRLIPSHSFFWELKTRSIKRLQQTRKRSLICYFRISAFARCLHTNPKRQRDRQRITSLALRVGVAAFARQNPHCPVLTNRVNHAPCTI